MDGNIDITAKAHTKSAERDFDKLSLKLRLLRAAVSMAIPVARVAEAFRKFAGVIRSVGSAIGTILKRTALGALLLFALTIRQVITSIRESMNELIGMRGGKMAEDVEIIKSKFTELKAAVANAFLPLVEFAIPYIKMALDWLIQLFNKVAMITAAFLGQKQVLQVVAGSAAKLAKNAKEVEKAAKGALAAFDQIDVLQTDKGAEEISPATFATEMVPITDDILAKVQKIKDLIAAWWADPLGKIQETWGKIKDWFNANVINPIKEKWRAVWDLTKTPEFQQGALTGIQAVFGILPNWILTNVIMPIVNFFRDHWEQIKAGANVALLGIMASWTTLKTWFLESVITPIRIGFTTGLDIIGQKFREVFTGIQNFVWTTINNIIGFINNLVQAILEGMAVVSGLAAPAAPNIGGASGSVQIPHLATGAVIPPNSKFLAMLGDQRSGTNIEAPESLIRQIIREELGAGRNETIENIIKLDGEVLYKGFKKVERRHGGSLITGGMV